MQNIESACFLWALCMSSFSLKVPLQLDLYCMLLLVKIHFPKDLAMELYLIRNFIFPIQTIWPVMFAMVDTKYRKFNDFLITVYSHISTRDLLFLLDQIDIVGIKYVLIWNNALQLPMSISINEKHADFRNLINN